MYEYVFLELITVSKSELVRVKEFVLIPNDGYVSAIIWDSVFK